MPDAILSIYPNDCLPTSTQFLGNAGGFSGARFWKLLTPRGELCLRRWPVKHPTIEQLAWIHRVLARVHERGCDFVPVPISNSNGNRVVRADGYLWELTPWMPGIADLHRSASPERLSAAMQSLAKFHVAAATLQTEQGQSRGLVERYAFAERLPSGDLARWRIESSLHRDKPFFAQCESIMKLASPQVRHLPAALEEFRDLSFSLQPCIRDIWHDHVLLEGNRVTGIVDFGAMRLETVAGDVARLLGSLKHHVDDAWAIGLGAYEQVRTLSDQERKAAVTLEQCNTVLSGINWVRWLMFGDKTFDDTEAVNRRLNSILSNLR